jgi:DUF1680 family protein
MMWNWRMLAASGEARFTDVIERALYNGINSGMSLDGVTYCYRNPLAFDPASGDKIRNPWYDVTCCPPNLERTFGSLPGYFYSTSKDGLYVHLYDNSTLDWHLEDGTPLKVTQKTNYPWDGDVRMTLTPAQPADFTLNVRIPGWVRSAKVAVNGKGVEGPQAGQYLPIRRQWKAGDTVTLMFPMTAEVIAANPRVTENTGHVAVQRGPVVYCMEQIDQAKDTGLFDLAIDRDPKTIQAEHKAELLEGVTILRQKGAAYEVSPAQEALYAPASSAPPKTRPANLTLIPYYAWSNRELTAMQVWVPHTRV